MEEMWNILISHVEARHTFIYLFLICLVGSLASCPDPTIILEVLNFLLSSEVTQIHPFCLLRLKDSIRERIFI